MDISAKKELKNKHNLEHCQKTIETCPSKLSFSLYKGVPFCSLIQDHNSWGASVDRNKNINFKIFTFSDTEKVSVEVKKQNNSVITIPLEKIETGIFEKRTESGTVKVGDKYRFVIERPGHKPIKVRDPYSMKQSSLFQWSEIYDHNAFEWNDLEWMKNKNPNKVSRRANKDNHLTSIGNLRIYELNIATLTTEGTFEAAKKEFGKIAKEKKFNAVEIMPVENTFSFNWGYDGVDKFAPSHTLGDPDKLKELIDYAHSLNLNVIMDIVPNHLGPDMADLPNAGPYIDGKNPFGYKFNFEKDNNRYVREYIINSALNWATNYHCDGIRVDMTKFMQSDFTMKQMVAEINHHAPDVFLIAEDGRDNDARVTRPFSNQEKYENQHEHCAFINRIANNNVSLENLGFDSEWDFLFHKQIAASVLNNWDGRPKSMENLDYAIKHSGMRVKYPMSHDEIGNIDGTRLISKILQKELKLNQRVQSPNLTIQAQTAAHASHNLIKLLLGGDLDKMNQEELEAFLLENKIHDGITIEDVKEAYEASLKQHRLTVGKTYSVPGPKMIFQGDENANPAYFKFFRQFSTGYEKCLESKGYKSGKDAFLDSKLNSIKFSDEHRHYIDQTDLYTKDLNELVQENPALQTGNIINTVVHPVSNLHAIHCKKDNNEIFSISNFSSASYPNNYSIRIPKGKWIEVSNTDDSKYGGNDEYRNNIIESDGYNNTNISIPEYGMIYFKKIG